MKKEARRTLTRKIWSILSKPERKQATVLLGMMAIGMVLETLGIGLVIPAILLITQEDLGASYPALQPALDSLGNPAQETLIIAAMLILVGVYLMKSIYLAFLTWMQARYTLAVRLRLSRQLFTIYLRRNYSPPFRLTA